MKQMLRPQNHGGAMAVKSLDTLLAIKVINLMPGLRASDRRVGAALIEHFNRKRGRLDPSIARIAELLGYCTRTVIRSTQSLEAAGLFRKVRHGGYSSRNSYEPNWSRLAELGAAWNAKLHRNVRSERTNLSPVARQECHVGSDSDVTQTCSNRNLYEQTYSKRPSNEGRKTVQPSTRLPSLTPGTSSTDAACAEAERRWTSELHRRFAQLPITYGEVIERIDAEMRDSATAAELRRRGAGIEHVLSKLRIPSKPNRTKA
jgi:predicted transcriptional regulator